MLPQSVCRILLLLLLGESCFARGGGGGGGGSSGGSSSGDSDGSSSSGSSGGGGGGTYDYGGGSSGDGGTSSSGGSSGGGGSYTPYVPPCTTCECRQVARRIQLYELPGSYYNGTITIKHQLSDNSARDLAAIKPSSSGSIRCPADDASVKTYSIPALFTIGSNLNASDTNPVFWSLRGFPMPEQYGVRPNQIDVSFDLTHLRSSDFVATNHSEWKTTDVTSKFPHQPHTYWTTSLSSTGPSTWSANATYTSQPALERGSSAHNPDYSSVRSSNYITLYDVCSYGETVYYSDDGFPPSSPWPLGNTDTWTSTPTIFFDLGAQISITGIGSPNLTLNLTNTAVNRQVVSVSSESGSCSSYGGSSTTPPYYFKGLESYQWRDAYATNEKRHMWNVSAVVELGFEGTLVVVNSTRIVPEGNRPVWEMGNKATATSTSALGRNTRTATSAAVGRCAGKGLWVLTLIISFCWLLGTVLTG